MRKFLFTLLFLASLAAGAYFSFFVTVPNYAMTGVWLTFSLFMFALGWPEVAESISFLGNNIKLREVKDAINELKLLAEVFSRATLELIQGGGRWGGFADDEKGRTYEDIEKMLNGFGFKKDEILSIQSRWHYWVEKDHVHALMHNSNINHPEIPTARHAEWHVKRNEIYAKIESIQPNELKEVFQSLDGYTDKVKIAIEDLEYYKKNKKHRDITRWKQHENWFKS